MLTFHEGVCRPVNVFLRVRNSPVGTNRDECGELGHKNAFLNGELEDFEESFDY